MGKWNGIPNILRNWENNTFIQNFIISPLWCGVCRKELVHINPDMIMDRNEYVEKYYGEEFGIPKNEVGTYYSIKDHPNATERTLSVKSVLNRFNKKRGFTASSYYWCKRGCELYTDDKRINNTMVFGSKKKMLGYYKGFDDFI